MKRPKSKQTVYVAGLLRRELYTKIPRLNGTVEHRSINFDWVRLPTVRLDMPEVLRGMFSDCSIVCRLCYIGCFL